MKLNPKKLLSFALGGTAIVALVLGYASISGEVMESDYRELGRGRVASHLKANFGNLEITAIERELAELVQVQLRDSDSFIVAAESVGFTCDLETRKKCIYAGYIAGRARGIMVPPDDQCTRLFITVRLDGSAVVVDLASAYTRIARRAPCPGAAIKEVFR